MESKGIAARARVQRAEHSTFLDLEVNLEEMGAVAEQAIETLTELGDSLGLALAEQLLAAALNRQGRWTESYAAKDRALVHAEASGDKPARRMIIRQVCLNLYNGPAPVGEATRRVEELLRSSRDDAVLAAVIGRYLAAFLAMAARFDEAREHLQRSGQVLDELDHSNFSWMTRFAVAEVNELAGDRAAAEQELSAVWLRLRDTGGGAIESRALRAASHLALLYCDDGRWEAAADCLGYGREVPEPIVFRHQATVLRTAARARLAAHADEHAAALRLARLAVDVAEQSGYLNLKARLWVVLSTVLRDNGQTAEADASVAAALRLYEQKGNIAAATRLRAAAGE